jgi:membrane protease YdiL (CAAX protease family)
MDTGRSGRWRSVLLSRHGLRKGDGLSYVFSSLFFFVVFFFFEISKVKATLKFPPGF